MPSRSIILKPGVDKVMTPSLNEAGISASNMIRFREGLVEKRGGWTSYYAGLPGAVRAICPFSGVDGDINVAAAGVGFLAVINGGTSLDIAPRVYTSTMSVSLSTTNGNAIVTVLDPNFSPLVGDTLRFNYNVAVGGMILFAGSTFTVASVVDGTNYTITGPNNATSTVTSGGALATLSTTAGSYSFTYTLSNIGTIYAAGRTFVFSPNTTCGGLTLGGSYYVSASSTNVLTLLSTVPASSTASATVSVAAGQYSITYYPQNKIGSALAGSPVSNADWSLASYGTSLLACPQGGSIYSWTKTNNNRTATLVANAPTALGIFVADAQQMIVAYHAGIAYGDSNYVAWSDTGNMTVWTASGTNQAGSYRIPTGSLIVGGCTASNQNLIWTDIDVWSMQYIGYPLVWGFNKIGTGCGLISQFAWAKLGPTVYWMSQKEFWVYDGSAPRALNCPLWDNVFPAISTANIYKIRGASNSAFNEVVWFFPSSNGSGENDTYVCFNPVENTWDYGSMARSAWADQSTAGLPLGGDPSGNIFQHETSPDAAGGAISSSFTTGWFTLDEGETFSFVDWIRPDINFTTGAGTVQVSVSTRNYTADTPTVAGPYSVTAATQYINTRCRGRYISLTFASTDVGSFWRLGRVQVRFQPNGRR